MQQLPDSELPRWQQAEAADVYARHMWGALLLASAMILGACGDGYPDRWDYCDSPTDTSVDSLDVVRPVREPSEPVADGFVTLADPAAVPVTFGGQGFQMIDVYLRMTGAVPGCIAQTSALRTLDDQALVSESSARVTFRQADASYRTWTIWLVLTDEIPRSELIKLVVTAGGRTSETRITIEPRT